MSSNGCSSNLFGYSWAASNLALDAFGVLVSLSMGGMYIAVTISRHHVQKLAPWWIFGVAVFLSIAAWIISIVNDVLTDCELIDNNTETSLWITTGVLFWGLTYLLWLAVLIFPLTMNILELANKPRRQLAIVLGLLYGLTFALWIAYAACTYTLQLSRGYIYGDYDNSSLVRAARALNATETVFYFITTAVGCVLLIIALIKLRGVSVVTKGLPISVYVTVAFFFASILLQMVEVFDQVVALQTWTIATTTAAGFLDIIFIFGAAYGMLFTAASRTWAPRATDHAFGEDYNYSAVQTNGQTYGGMPELSGHGRGPVEMAGNGTSTLYPHAPTSYHKGYAHPSELSSTTVTQELGGHPRYEAPGYPMH